MIKIITEILKAPNKTYVIKLTILSYIMKLSASWCCCWCDCEGELKQKVHHEIDQSPVSSAPAKAMPKNPPFVIPLPELKSPPPKLLVRRESLVISSSSYSCSHGNHKLDDAPSEPFYGDYIPKYPPVLLTNSQWSLPKPPRKKANAKESKIT